ncbi:MAG: DNA-directed polymerase subunit alpha, DNA-directed polymerase subunit alpha [Candidatus Paceibacter sp.]|jgi:DNA-directed RNA polymerase subunit alpha|nr:DNA-directed polymerase subunit alpha, DNA-directed polymerase subunit alpha [Candidatus Paceibacter sp.]
MSDFNVVLPSKPKIIHEEGSQGVYEIDGLYPGYGHTLGNSLRRIILSSLPGSAITTVKIAGVSHEFSSIEGVKEDVITLLLNLKKVRIQMLSDEPQTINLKVKGIKEVTAADIEVGGQIEILNKDLVLAHITDKSTELDIEMTIEKGLGYVPREVLQKNKVDIGVITLDASFTPIRRVHYEVENMRVGDRTDFNRLKISIETDGTLTPKEALERSIETMIQQLKSIVGFKEEEELMPSQVSSSEASNEEGGDKEIDTEALKTRVESLGLSQRTMNALSNANIRTVGGLSRKREQDILEIEGLGAKGLQEIKKALSNFGIVLKS